MARVYHLIFPCSKVVESRNIECNKIIQPEHKYLRHVITILGLFLVRPRACIKVLLKATIRHFLELHVVCFCMLII